MTDDTKVVWLYDNMSNSITKLAPALVKLQAALTPAHASGENPFFKRGENSHKYAKLEDCWEAVRKPLAENKFAVLQRTLKGDGQLITLETMLIHESGEFISGHLTLRPVKADPQGMGSAITYARRYGLAAIVGLVQEDDDGNEASQPSAQESRVVPVEGDAFVGSAEKPQTSSKVSQTPLAKELDTINDQETLANWITKRAFEFEAETKKSNKAWGPFYGACKRCGISNGSHFFNEHKQRVQQ